METTAAKSEKKIKAKGEKLNSVYLRNNLAYYMMLLPGVILIILFRFVPLYGMQIAFKDFNMNDGITGSPWAGVKWFKILFESTDFFRILKNTLAINFLEILVVFFGSIILAILISEVTNTSYKKVVQTVSYLPYFISWVVVGGLIKQILLPSSFAVQTICNIFGLEPTNILLQENKFYGVVVMGELWKSAGWNTILYLAAIAGISPELYEASRIDGAGKFKQIWHITLPGLKFIIVTTLLMRVGAMMNVGFEKVFVLQNGMNIDKAEVFSTYNYKVGLGKWNMSYSTALSCFESIVNFSLVFIFDRVAKLLGEEGLF